MKISILKETAAYENRVAVTPEVVKKLIEMGCEVSIEKDAGQAAHFTNDAYEKAGAQIVTDKDQLTRNANILMHVSPISNDVVDKLPSNALTLGLLKPHENEALLKKIAQAKITAFALEMVPRISRAQSMDVLSSQSNLAGYRAVIEGAHYFNRAFPMMMTAAGTIPPARVLILGAGVAGLQAIATARRLGAIVSAFDVRAAAKEQVESLGASFVEVQYQETGEGTGGYAKEMSEGYKKAQADKLASVLKTQDIVITTAQIPGKPAPVLITKDMIKGMKSGSVIVDLAVESGGNCEGVKLGEVVQMNGVSILGYPNMASRIAHDTSQMYAKNVLNFFKLLVKDKQIALEWNDEIIKNSAVTHDGKIVHTMFGGKGVLAAVEQQDSQKVSSESAPSKDDSLVKEVKFAEEVAPEKEPEEDQSSAKKSKKSKTESKPTKGSDN